MTERQELLVDRDRMYALTRDGAGDLYLEVVSGGIAMENVVVKLNDYEAGQYVKDGKPFLDRLALDIARNREKYLR